MSEDARVGRFSGRHAWASEQGQLVHAERLYLDQINMPRRGRPAPVDQDWRRLTRRLELLGRKRRARLRLPSPANDRGHRHSRLDLDDSLTYRLVSAGCVALASIALLTLIGAAAVDPNALLALPR